MLKHRTWNELPLIPSRSVQWKTAWRASFQTRSTSLTPSAAHRLVPPSRASPAPPPWCDPDPLQRLFGDAINLFLNWNRKLNKPVDSSDNGTLCFVGGVLSWRWKQDGHFMQENRMFSPVSTKTKSSVFNRHFCGIFFSLHVTKSASFQCPF